MPKLEEVYAALDEGTEALQAALRAAKRHLHNAKPLQAREQFLAVSDVANRAANLCKALSGMTL